MRNYLGDEEANKGYEGNEWAEHDELQERVSVSMVEERGPRLKKVMVAFGRVGVRTKYLEYLLTRSRRKWV